MAEYIERGAAIDAVTAVYVRTAGYKARERVFEAEEAVHRLPVADVAPVVHGRWERQELAPPSYLFCSECGFPKKRGTWNFCPNCGANMDGDSDA